MNSNTYFVFDFDNTLYNTEKLKKDLKDLAVSSGLEVGLVQEIYNEVFWQGTRACFNLTNYADILSDRLTSRGLKFDSKKFGIIREKIEAGGYVLAGADELLSEVKKLSEKIILLTLGEITWQKEKLNGSGFGKYFDKDNILFTEQSGTGKVESLKLFFNGVSPNIIVFEDKPPEARSILSAFKNSIAMMRYEKKDERYNELDFERLAKEYPGRFFWSDNLKDLKKIFLNYVK
jgi:hypothetical protein